MKFHLEQCLILLTLVFISDATIAPPGKNKKTKTVKELVVNKGPVDRNVFDRNLVQDEPSSEQILRECGTYYKNTSARQFNGPTLGFVTPVNEHFIKFKFCFYISFDFLAVEQSRI